MDDRKELFAALAAAQAEVRSQAKDSENKFHKYKYTSMEDLIVEAKRVLGLHGLAAAIDDSTIAFGTPYDAKEFVDGKQVTVTYRDDVLESRCTLRHSSGQSFSCCRQQYIMPEKGRPPDKALATANTFAIGYWLRDLLLIPRVDDEPDKRDDRNYEPKQRQAKDDYRQAAVLPDRQSVIPQPPPAAADSGASPAMKDDQTKVSGAVKAINESAGIKPLLKIGAMIQQRVKEGVFSESTARNLLEGSLAAKLADLAKWALEGAKAESDVQDVVTPVTKAFKDKVVANAVWAEVMKMATEATNRLAKTPTDEMAEFFGGDDK